MSTKRFTIQDTALVAVVQLRFALSKLLPSDSFTILRENTRHFVDVTSGNTFTGQRFDDNTSYVRLLDSHGFNPFVLTIQFQPEQRILDNPLDDRVPNLNHHC